MDLTGGDTFVDPKKKFPVKPSPTPELPQMRLNNAETGPFTGTL
jgi:hypothetical protein